MHWLEEQITLARRKFLTSTASGVGLAALAPMFREEGLLASASLASFSGKSAKSNDPLAVKKPHFAAKAKRYICIFLEGGPSQMDLFDPKPQLNKLNGQPLPESMTKNVRFAFLQKDTATIMGSPRKFTPHGQCG